MKQISLILAICTVICLLLSGCGGTANDGKDTVADTTENTPIETTEAMESESVSDELKEPVMEWWELYNPNGIDTFTAVISNPNDVPIDVTYDVAYYKDGSEVARSEGFYNSNILPGHRELISGNWDIPESSKADNVTLENVFVSKSYYEPIDGKYEYAGVVDNHAVFDFEFESKPTLASIWFVLYNDINGNGSFDKGEIVAVSSDSLTEQTGQVSFATDVFDYTNFDVFFNAY